MYNKIAKIGIEVEDIEKSLDFYVNIMGMRILERFPQPDKTQNVFLNGGSVILELMPRTNAGEKLNHIAVFVDDHDEALEYFRKKNVPVVMEHKVVDQNIHLADVADPNGIRIRLFRRDK